jgi:uncharacterized protein involved in exopolysaccharide biosynthesis
MTLRDALQIAYRRKVLIVAAIVLVGAAAYVIASRETPKFQASSQVYVDQQDLPSLLANTANPNAAVPPDRCAWMAA